MGSDGRSPLSGRSKLGAGFSIRPRAATPPLLLWHVRRLLRQLHLRPDRPRLRHALPRRLRPGDGLGRHRRGAVGRGLQDHAGHDGGAAGAAQFLADRIPSNVVNAGDGRHEHPTQGLLDLLTIRDHVGKIDGLKVCIIGDILHSRVARSNIYGLLTLGAEVAVCGPPTLLPLCADEFGVEVFTRVEEAIEWAEVLNVLRLQLERMEGGYVPSLREYNRIWGVTNERLAAAKRDLLILHPGPMNRGVEIDSDVADGEHSVILDQVTNGVAVRMAVLYLLAGGQPESAEAAKQGDGA